MSASPWQYTIEPADWAAMTRMHESSHVAASEALGIPVVDVWANPDRDVAHGGHYLNTPADSQLQSVVYLIGAEGGAHELRDRGYDDATVWESVLRLGYADRQHAQRVIDEAAQEGWQLDADRAYDDALAVLRSPGFTDAAHNVAQALADRGDRLTGADVRAALGSYTLDGSVWVPTAVELRAERQIEPPAPVPGAGESYGEEEIDI